MLFYRFFLMNVFVVFIVFFSSLLFHSFFLPKRGLRAKLPSANIRHFAHTAKCAERRQKRRINKRRNRLMDEFWRCKYSTSDGHPPFYQMQQGRNCQTELQCNKGHVQAENHVFPKFPLSKFEMCLPSSV